MNAFAFYRPDLPVAASMLQLASSIEVKPRTSQVIPHFMCVWVSFNNIYTKLWHACRDRQGADNQPASIFACSEDPTIELKQHPKYERQELEHVFAHFTSELKAELLHHSSTTFFAKRTCTIPAAARLLPDVPRSNGVLNINRSTSTCPAYTPIDTAALRRFRSDPTLAAERDLVSRQAFEIVYTVRNNIFHGGKSATNSNSLRVTANALNLLDLIVADFIRG